MTTRHTLTAARSVSGDSASVRQWASFTSTLSRIGLGVGIVGQTEPHVRERAGTADDQLRLGGVLVG